MDGLAASLSHYCLPHDQLMKAELRFVALWLTVMCMSKYVGVFLLLCGLLEGSVSDCAQSGALGGC